MMWGLFGRRPGKLSEPGHVQVAVPGAAFSVDEALVDMVAALAGRGMPTSCSCQGVPCERSAYVKFVRLDDAVAFVRLVEPVMWCQMRAEVPCWQQADPDAYGDWEWVVEWDSTLTGELSAAVVEALR